MHVTALKNYKYVSALSKIESVTCMQFYIHRMPQCIISVLLLSPVDSIKHLLGSGSEMSLSGFVLNPNVVIFLISSNFKGAFQPKLIIFYIEGFFRKIHVCFFTNGIFVDIVQSAKKVLGHNLKFSVFQAILCILQIKSIKAGILIISF